MDPIGLITTIFWIISSVVIPILLLYFSKFLWKVYLDSSRDETSKLPLPPGTYGWPFIGNMLDMIRMVNSYAYSKNHNTGVMQIWVVHDVMLFKLFDWTMASIIAFDWLLRYGRHASRI